jgi:hypothetical protein
MPKNKIIITLGITIALLPRLGFPPIWEAYFQVIAGLSIVALSVWGNIDKKLTLKARAHRRHIERENMRKNASMAEVRDSNVSELDSNKENQEAPQ